MFQGFFSPGKAALWNLACGAWRECDGTGSIHEQAFAVVGVALKPPSKRPLRRVTGARAD